MDAAEETKASLEAGGIAVWVLHPGGHFVRKFRLIILSLHRLTSVPSTTIFPYLRERSIDGLLDLNGEELHHSGLDNHMNCAVGKLQGGAKAYHDGPFLVCSSRSG